MVVAIDQKSVVGSFFELLATSWVPHALYAAAALEIPDALGAEERTAVAVAASVDADAVAVERLLRALVTIGFVENAPGDAYALTPLGSLLRSDHESSLRSPVLLGGGQGSLRAWGQLAECVRTGSTAAKLLDGTDEPFAPIAEDSPEQRVFDSAMAESTRQMAEAIANAYDFSTIDTIVDVGGGYGALLPPILHAYSGMRGVVFDRPHCRGGAQRLLDDAGVADRCTFIGGDFFVDTLPPASAYVLKSVIHDWDDARSAKLLRRCRQHMTAGTRLLIIEVVVPDQLEQSTAHRRIVWADLRMLVSTGGRERTRTDYDGLAREAGLRIASVTRTGAALDVIEAVVA
jgi:hypothetical protein